MTRFVRRGLHACRREQPREELEVAESSTSSEENCRIDDKLKRQCLVEGIEFCATNRVHFDINLWTLANHLEMEGLPLLDLLIESFEAVQFDIDLRSR